MADLDKYRIKRSDPRNIVIERKVESDKDNWVIIGFYGNSVKSLISGLYNLIVSNYTPSGQKVADDVKRLELELVSGLARIEKMIEEAKLCQISAKQK